MDMRTCYVNHYVNQSWHRRCSYSYMLHDTLNQYGCIMFKDRVSLGASTSHEIMKFSQSLNILGYAV